MGTRFLIGQLACYGDCLYVTTVARQIKADHPDSHITWAIATRYKSILNFNPHVDEVWDVDIQNNDFYYDGWHKFEAEANRRLQAGIYDKVFYTQISPHWRYFDGTIRSSELRGYNRPITVPIDPVVVLSDEEVDRVTHFAADNQLNMYREVILFECAPGSGQSFVNVNMAISVAEKVLTECKDVCFILSSPTPLNHPHPQILDASSLTYRDNAELTKHCTLLIGCSSGITWLATSTWAKKLNTLQLLSRGSDYFAGVKYDLQQWGQPTNHIIEVTKKSIDYVTGCVLSILNQGFSKAKQQYDEVYQPGYHNFRAMIKNAIWDNNANNKGNVRPMISAYAKNNPHLKAARLTAIAAVQVLRFYRIKNVDGVMQLARQVYRKLFK
ncbi:hypothetical protein [Mucilaginibacter sp.]|uniref:glycosyltransferase family 9 protein n=1 Tax=Mucilaginibacter sp. TaxID=1882438 RepID=UPI0035BC5414